MKKLIIFCILAHASTSLFSMQSTKTFVTTKEDEISDYDIQMTKYAVIPPLLAGFLINIFEYKTWLRYGLANMCGILAVGINASHLNNKSEKGFYPEFKGTNQPFWHKITYTQKDLDSGKKFHIPQRANYFLYGAGLVCGTGVRKVVPYLWTALKRIRG